MDRMTPGGYEQRTRMSGCVRLGERGFTVVELVAVIVLLSILGAVAMARMVSPDLYAPAIVTQALVAESRFAQQVATSRADADAVRLMVDQSGTNWRLQVAIDVGGASSVMRTELIEAENTFVQASSAAASGSLGAATALVVEFDHAGDLSSVTIGGASGDPDAGVELTITGDSTRQACIYASGYANDEACT